VRKVVYFYDSPFTESLQRMFFLDDMAASGFTIEYWDLSAVYRRGALSASYLLERPYVRRLSTRRELESRIAREASAGTIFLPCGSLDPRFFGLHRALTKHGAPLFAFAYGRVPVPKGTLSQKIVANADFLINPRKLAKFLSNRLVAGVRKLKLTKTYDVIFAAGQAAVSEVSAGGAATATGGGKRVVPINAHYYDDFMALRGKSPRLVAGRYGVFLDDNLPYHPDIRYLGIEPVAPGPLYEAQNAFFDCLEKRYGFEIAIAAHPKSDYKINPFGGRRIFRHKTQELTEHCEFAITTVSTSLGYAVLYRKPLCLVTTRAIVAAYDSIKLDPLQKLWAEYLGAPRVHIDDERERREFAFGAVDAERYDAYKYDFIVSRGCEDKSSREIFKEFVRNY